MRAEPKVSVQTITQHYTRSQDDDVQQHKACFKDCSWNILEWTAQCPDWNLIKTLWHDLNEAGAAQDQKDISELEAFAHW